MSSSLASSSPGPRPRFIALAALVWVLLAIVHVPAVRGAVPDGADTLRVAATDGAQADSGADTATAMPAANVAMPRHATALTRRDLRVLGALGATAVALFPVDAAITGWVRASPRRDHVALERLMEGVETGVETGTVVAAAAAWTAGLASGSGAWQETGLHTYAAMAVASPVTHVLKGIFGRARPYAAGDTAAHDWRAGRGFGGGSRRSFPSGHTAQAFAFATAVHTEVAHHWPRTARPAAVLLYTGATLGGVARIYHDKHWASDVAMGAAVGYLAARGTLALLHRHPDNWLDRAGLHTRLVPTREGATLTVTLPAPR